MNNTKNQIQFLGKHIFNTNTNFISFYTNKYFQWHLSIVVYISLNVWLKRYLLFIFIIKYSTLNGEIKQLNVSQYSVHRIITNTELIALKLHWIWKWLAIDKQTNVEFISSDVNSSLQSSPWIQCIITFSYKYMSCKCSDAIQG